VKRITAIIISLFTIFSLTGCNRILGGATLENFGMEFTSQIEMMEECLDIDLDDLNDSNIKTIYSHTDPEGNDLTIKYIDLDGAGDVFENDIENRENWNTLPYNTTVETLLKSSGANEQFAFDDIKEGRFIISGVSLGKDEFDFDYNNFNNWYVFNIGIWDSNAETLYYISITDQSKT
jgi:hypothetical protein